MMANRADHLLSADALREGLHPRRVGRRIIVIDEVDSTNTYALDTWSRQDAVDVDGAVVFTEHQTAGRGRLGRRWLSPRGASLQFTVLMVEPGDRFCHARWMMASAVAVLEGIAAATDVEPVIRWPNDLYVGDKKLCGILIETRPFGVNQFAVAMGIGINCLQQAAHFPPELRKTATSLEIESVNPVDRNQVAMEVMRCLDRRMANLTPDHDDLLTAAWKEHSVDIGSAVTLIEGGFSYSGRIIDILPSTGLLVQLDTGARKHFDPAIASRA